MARESLGVDEILNENTIKFVATICGFIEKNNQPDDLLLESYKCLVNLLHYQQEMRTFFVNLLPSFEPIQLLLQV